MESPRSCSIAATVELSTPPLIATAVVPVCGRCAAVLRPNARRTSARQSDGAIDL